MEASGPPQLPPEESKWHGPERRGDLRSTSPGRPDDSSAANAKPAAVDEYEETINYLEHTSGEIFKSIGRILRAHHSRISTVYRLVTSPPLRERIIDWGDVEKRLIDAGVIAPPGKFRKLCAACGRIKQSIKNFFTKK